MKSIARFIKPYIARMSLGLVIKLIGTIMDLVLPWLLSVILDDVAPAGNRGDIFRYGGLMVLCAMVAVSFTIIANRMAAAVSKDITRELRSELYERILRLSAPGMDRFSVPSLISRLTNDTYNVHQLLDKIQRLGVRAPLLMIGGMIMAFLLDAKLALILLCIAPLIGLMVYLVSKKGLPLYAEVQRRVDGLVRVVRENAAGVRVVRALSKADYESSRFEGVNSSIADIETRAGSVMAVSNPIMNLLLNTGLMLVILAGAWRVNEGVMQTGAIIAFLSYFTIILNATLSVTKIFVLWTRGAASAARIGQVLDSPDPLPLAAPKHKDSPCHIEFDRVSFSYNGKRDNLTDISFSLLRGQTLGLFGPTGSGKTTLISLIMRAYDPRSGAIYINGDRLTGIPRDKLSAMFGAVFQNDVLFNDTVYENISFYRDIPMERVRAAAECAQAAEFIGQLPNGYDTPLDIRGANLSGGQRQRLLIARALAGSPEILILDDAESALDYRTDALLRAAMQRMHGDATTVVVSERVASIRSADLILVLDDGKIIGRGTHAQLMAGCEHYRRIAQVQMGGQA